jgi:hypothetical protein
MKLVKLKLVTLLIFILIGFTVYGILYEQNTLLTLGHVLLLPMVGFWYGIKRKWSLKSIDKVMYCAFVVGSFADSVILVDWGQKGELLSVSFSLLMNLLIMVAFRKEGTRIYSDKTQDIPKVVVPALLVFLFFGYVLRLSVPNSVYFISILYAVLEALLAAHGYFRSAKFNSYLWVVFGVSLVLFKDAIFSFHFFIYNNTKLYMYAIQYPLNILAYFTIAVGIALNQEDGNTSEKISNWRFLKSKINLLMSNSEDTNNIKRRISAKVQQTFTNLLIKPQGNQINIY